MLSVPRAVLLLVGCLGTAACGDTGTEARKPAGPRAPAHEAGFIRDEVVAEGGFRRRTVLTDTYLLPANRINVMPEPYRVRPFDVEERVFITAWSSNTEDADGSRAPDDVHCHAVLSDIPVKTDGIRLWSGLCTDGFTPRFVLPEGFAVAVDRGATYILRPMFNNRRPDARLARMRLVIDYVTESQAKGRLRALRGLVVTAQVPETYSVAPKETDVKSRVFEMPFTGRIHAIGAHLHPYGDSVSLARETDLRLMFTAKMQRAADLGDWKLSTFASQEGFYVTKGEPFRVTGTYINDSDKKTDAMAGLFVFYDPGGRPDK